MQDLTCYLDMDGVIADFVGGCCRLLDRPDPYKHYEGHDFIRWWGYEPAYFYQMCTDSFWADLEPTPWASELLVLCHEMFRRTVIVTSPPKENMGPAVEGKVKWLRRFCPDLAATAAFVLDKAVLAHRGALLLDDTQRVAEGFAKAGGRAILLPQPWNDARAAADRRMDYVRDEIGMELTSWIN